MELGFVTSPSGARFTVANQHAARFGGLLKDLEDAGYAVQGNQSGGYNPRNIAGTNTPSRHAHGAAIDINWTDNPRGGKGKIPADLARSLAAKHGLVWGGDWKNPDPMHFEVPGQPGHTYSDGHNHGAPTQGMQQPTAAQGTVPMPNSQQSGPNQSFLQQLLNPTVMAGLAGMESAWRGGSASEGMQTGLKTGLAQQAAQRQQAQQAAISNMLQNPQALGNLPPALVEIARATGDVGPIAAFITKTAEGTGRTDDIKEYEYARQRGFKGSLQDWMVNKRTTQGEYSKNPIFGTRVGPDGKPQTVMLQAGSRGDAAETKLPEGVAVNAQKPIEIDAGTHTVLLDPITRTPIGQVPKNVGEVSRQREVGTETGKAQVNLPSVESTAKNIEGYLDAVEKDPNLDNMLGYRGYLPNVTPGARALQAKIDQLNSQAFLVAFERLKGAGAITEREGAAAAQALTRLKEMIQSGADYRAAMKDFRQEVRRLVDVAKAKAGGGAAGTQQTPAGGGQTDLKSKYGLE